MLRALADDIWVDTHKLRFWGTPVITRMTVLRLADGGLFVHGGIPLTDERRRAIAGLGPVRWVVAPNRYHHLYAGQWAELPGARLYGAPGLERKRKDLRFQGILGATAPEGWAGQIDQEPLGGTILVGEVVFFHRASRTLIVTDLFFNYPRSRSLLVRLSRLIEDCDGKFTVPRLVRLAARDRNAFSRSVERILSWDFDRVIMAHGDIVESGGHPLVAAALRKITR